MKEPKISIGIPFLIWNKYIDESVNRCVKLNYKNFVVILVPNSGAKIPKKYLKNKRIIVRPTKESKIPLKRNAAIRAAKADFYACLDSDSFPEKNWLKNAVRVFQKQPETIVVGGPNLSPNYSDTKRRAVSSALKSYLVTGPRSFTKQISHGRFTDDLPTCNFIFRKEALESAGYFNEALRTGEDTYFCTRILKNNGYIYYSKDVIVYHHNRKLFVPFIKQKIVFGYAVIPLAKRGFAFRFYFILPLIFVIFASFGWISLFISPLLFHYWLVLAVLYLFTVSEESVRLSKAGRDIPLTFVAIVIGNIVPGIGTLMALAGIKINMVKFYRNF